VSRKLGRGIVSQISHYLFNLLSTVNPLKRYGLNAFFIEAIFFVKLIKAVVKSHSPVFIVRSHFAYKHCCADSVLISGICARKTSVALLKAENKRMAVILFKLLNFLAYKLKSCKNLNYLGIVIFCYRPYHLCGNNGFNNHSVIRELSLLFSSVKHIFS